MRRATTTSIRRRPRSPPAAGPAGGGRGSGGGLAGPAEPGRLAVPGADHLDGGIGAQAQCRGLHGAAESVGTEVKLEQLRRGLELPALRTLHPEHPVRRRGGHADHPGRVGHVGVRLRAARLPLPGRAVRPLPQHPDRPARGHRHPDVPDHAAARLGQQLSGAHPAVGVHRVRHLPAAAVLPHHPARARGGRQDRRRRAPPDPAQHHRPDLGAGVRRPGRVHLHLRTGTASCGR